MAETVTQAVTQAVPDLDPIDRRMASAAVLRAVQQVFAP
jgi:hypothetical protein